MTQNLGFYDECSISELLNAAKKQGAIGVDVYDSEDDCKHFYFDTDDTEDAVLEYIDGGDEDYRFEFSSGDEQHLGTFYVVLGNDDGSAVYDSSANKWCDAIWDEIA